MKTTRIILNAIRLAKHLKKDDKGAVAIIVGLSLFALLGFGALAVDLGYSMFVKNELQNAADAGALAGAADLYLNNGASVNPNANQTAYDTAVANMSQKDAVHVEYIQRGHWSFGSRTFTPNDSLDAVDLWNLSTAELDANTDFINAVKVRVRTQNPVASFLSNIWGGSPSYSFAEAVAYIGFAGSLRPHDVDQPIAICKQSILNNEGEYDCTVGRMLNSGGNDVTHNTAGWTNFSQPCETANASEMRSLICSSGNPVPITLGEGMGATGGVQDSTLRDLQNCMWNDASLDTDGDKIPDKPWNMTLPVIDCIGNNVSNCAVVKGAVNIDIVWITDKEGDPVPRKMGNWTCPSGYTEEQCWTSFTNHFNLKDVDGNTPAYAKKSIYFLPNCTPHDLGGTTGGENFGILAKIPVLVK